MKKVVFVDDSETILETMKMATEDIQDIVEVKTYLYPEEMLEEYKKGNVEFDLMFVDINMPKLNGFELVSAINLHSKEHGKIVALTTENTVDKKEKGKQVGISGWIVKPIPNGRILATIKKVLKIN